MTREPGEVTLGDWAHMRWGGHHRVVADEPEVDSAQPIRVACGKRFERSRVWHDPPLPHMTRCKGCERTT